MDYLSFSFLASNEQDESKVQELIKRAVVYLIENQFLVQSEEINATDGTTKTILK